MNKNAIDFDQISDEMIVESSLDYDVSGCYNTDEKFDMVKNVVRFLNIKDRDMVYMSFLAGKRQVDVAEILRKTQPAICYNIKRIKKQIAYVQQFLSNVGFLLAYMAQDTQLTAKQCDLMLLLLYSSSVTRAADIYGIHQITCRNALDKIWKRIEYDAPDIIEMFDSVVIRFNKIKNRLLEHDLCFYFVSSEEV